MGILPSTPRLSCVVEYLPFDGINIWNREKRCIMILMLKSLDQSFMRVGHLWLACVRIQAIPIIVGLIEIEQGKHLAIGKVDSKLIS